MLCRYVVRGFFYANNHREYMDIASFTTFDEALECYECQLDDDRVTAMFAEICIREIF